MPVYFMVFDAPLFRDRLTPALTASWRRRSFEPARELCSALLPAVIEFRDRYHTGPDEPLPVRVVNGLAFDRGLWRLLVGELLMYAAAEMPELQTAPETLSLLLGPGEDAGPERENWSPIRQAHFGSHDLVFGGFYRPEHAGYNDAPDVLRLAAYLDIVDPAAWTADALAPLAGPDSEDQEDELAFARQCFKGLRELYRQAAARGRVIICEVL